MLKSILFFSYRQNSYICIRLKNIIYQNLFYLAKKNVIIIGAAGPDFHNFNTYYRDNESYNVVAFTAAQIPDIDGRKYPAELAGKLYPAGIPIFAEQDLPRLIKELKADNIKYAGTHKKLQYYIAITKKTDKNLSVKFFETLANLQKKGEIKKILDKYEIK